VARGEEVAAGGGLVKQKKPSCPPIAALHVLNNRCAGRGKGRVQESSQTEKKLRPEETQTYRGTQEGRTLLCGKKRLFFLKGDWECQINGGEELEKKIQKEGKEGTSPASRKERGKKHKKRVRGGKA